MMRKNKNVWILCGALLLSGCEGERADLPVEETPTGEMIEVSIIPSGIELFGTDTSADADNTPHAGRSITRATPWSGEPKNRIHLVQDFDEERMLETIIEEVPQAEASTRAIPLVNATLRVVACNSKGEKVDECVYEVFRGVATPKDENKTTLRLTVDNEPYTFHCYSPAYEVDADMNVVMPKPGENFIYAQTSVTATPATKEVKIPTLKRMMSMLSLASITTLKDFDTIESNPTLDSLEVTLTGAFGTSATLRLGNGNEALTTIATPDTKITLATGGFGICYLYPGVNAGKIELASKVTVSGKEYIMKPITSTDDFILVAGKSYSISLTVSYKNYIESRALGLKVAKGYLYVKDGYPFMYTNQGSLEKVNFEFGVTPLTADLFHTGMFSYDPCQKALKGSWRLPNENDINKFNDIKNRVFGEYKTPTGQVEKGWYWGTKSKKEAEENQDNFVFLRLCDTYYNEDSQEAHGEYGAILSSATPYPSHLYEQITRPDLSITIFVGPRFAKTLSFYEGDVCITKDRILLWPQDLDSLDFGYQGVYVTQYLPIRCVSDLN